MLDQLLPQGFYLINKHIDWPRIKKPGYKRVYALFMKNFELTNKNTHMCPTGPAISLVVRQTLEPRERNQPRSCGPPPLPHTDPVKLTSSVHFSQFHPTTPCPASGCRDLNILRMHPVSWALCPLVV